MRTLLGTIADLDRAMGAALLEHTKAQLLAPLPRIGEVNLAQIIGEVGPILARAVDVDHTCAEVGATPVTKESGKGRAVNFRGRSTPEPAKPCSPSPTTAATPAPGPPSSTTTPEARGKRHPHAIRILMRAWMHVIWACWHTNTTYDPNLHGAEQRLVNTTNKEIAA